jgi:hypothetical protein
MAPMAPAMLGRTVAMDGGVEVGVAVRVGVDTCVPIDVAVAVAICVPVSVAVEVGVSVAVEWGRAAQASESKIIAAEGARRLAGPASRPHQICQYR